MILYYKYMFHHYMLQHISAFLYFINTKEFHLWLINLAVCLWLLTADP
jgi:hypothetical protein